MTHEQPEGRVRTKEEAQQELREKFGMANTSEFRLALREGKINKAEEWLQYIVDHKEDFPQYHKTWDSWLADRKKEIEIFGKYREKVAAGEQMEKISSRSKEEAQQELVKIFGMAKTSDFRDALKRGEIEKAKKWLEHIINHKGDFPQYLANWDKWLADRKREIAEVEGK
ncbi:MAG: hypothetical protein ACOZAG_02900 [Patescibacteria group bacterium]